MRKIDLLIADDDKQLCAFLSAHLNQTMGYNIVTANDGFSAVDLTAFHQPKIVILDLSMPLMDGMGVLKKLREWSKGAIMILSATDEEQQKVKALDLGADDYLTKPFGIDELLARVRTLVRRFDSGEASFDSVDPIIRFGDVCMDLSKRTVTKKDTELSLTRTEYELLRELASNKDKIMTHAELLSRIWGPEYGSESEYLRTFIKQIRKKVEIDPSRPQHIITQPGMGYRLMSN